MDSAEDEAESLQEPVGMEDAEVIRSSKHGRTDTHMSSQRLQQHVQGLHRMKSDGSSY